MKLYRIFTALLLALSLICAVGCGEDEKTDAGTDAVTNAGQTEQSDGSVDVDLTTLSSTMVYSEVYNMMSTPSDYIGKAVKMKGTFSVYDDPSTGAQYYSCIISDATACCSQGMEFVLAGEYSYPADYPALGEEITVTGVYETYYEGEYLYCRLADAVLS